MILKIFSKLIKRNRFHILVWTAMFAYFVFAPDLFTMIFTKNGKPVHAAHVDFVESERILYSIDGFETYLQDGEELYNLYGWALMVPEDSMPASAYVREIVLTSGDRQYIFSVESGYRNPDLTDKLSSVQVDLETLGFRALMAEDAIKPGTYRIGILFRDASTGSVFYWDKPAHFLVKTPNTFRLQKK
jgi:hypothetical protein